MAITATSFHVSSSSSSANKEENKTPRIGLLIKKSNVDASQFLSQHLEFDCLFDAKSNIDLELPIVPDDTKSWQYTFTVGDGDTKEEGFYTTFFTNCEPNTAVSMNLKVVQFNPGPDYLSAGESLLPAFYFFLALAYLFVDAIYYSTLRDKSNHVLMIHYLMMILVVLKTFSLFFDALKYGNIQTSGSAEGWQVPFYIVEFLKGVMLFTVLLLIGTGWTLIKPFISDQDKKVVMFVIPLQVLANTAAIIIEETNPGNPAFDFWVNVLRLVDIICLALVLVPIIWSIKHLRDSSQTEDKASRNYEKLQLFREFYILVVSYIYCTRIIKYLLDATLYYDYIWVSIFFSELSTLCFYVITGYKFRPLSQYAVLISDEDDDNRSDNRNVEMQANTRRRDQADSLDL